MIFHLPVAGSISGLADSTITLLFFPQLARSRLRPYTPSQVIREERTCTDININISFKININMCFNININMCFNINISFNMNIVMCFNNNINMSFNNNISLNINIDININIINI